MSTEHVGDRRITKGSTSFEGRFATKLLRSRIVSLEDRSARGKTGISLKSRRDAPQGRRPFLEAVRLLLKGTEFPIAYHGGNNDAKTDAL